MKRTVFIAAFLLFATGSLASGPATIADAELSLGGVALGDTESAVLAILPTPYRATDTGEGTLYEANGLSVQVGWLEEKAPGVERRVTYVASTSSTQCTPSGVCPGMSYSIASTTYGAAVLAKRERGTFMEYYSSESQCWLQLAIERANIASIAAVCQP